MNGVQTWPIFWDPAVVNANSIFNVGLWATNGVADWASTGGNVTYAPAQQCLMNHTGGTSRFCAVCAEALVEVVTTLSGGAFSDPLYHQNYQEVFVEYRHRRSGDPDYPKQGLLAIDNDLVPTANFLCHEVRGDELCSVDVTDFIGNGAHQLTFLEQDVTRSIDLLTIQVVNGNGAPLPLFPVTDLSGIGSADYLTEYFWDTSQGDLVLEFSAALTP